MKFTLLFKIVACILIVIVLFTHQSPVKSQNPSGTTILAIAWRPDGQQIAVATSDGNLRILNPQTGETIQTLLQTPPDASSEGVASLAWSYDGTKFAATEYKNVHVWNATTWVRLTTFTPTNLSDIVSIAWSSDNTEIATTNIGSNFNIWTATTGQKVFEFNTARFAYMYSANWNPNTNVIATTGGRIDFWSPTQVEPLDYLEDAGEISTVDWNPTGTMLVSAGDGIVTVWDVSTKQIVRLLLEQWRTQFIQSVDWSPDGTRIAGASDDGSLFVWDANTGKVLAIYQHEAPLYALAWSPDGRKLAYGGAGSTGTLQIVNLPPNAAFISDKVWLDSNGNGLQDSEEDGLEGVTVNLLRNDFSVAATTTTTTIGLYSFANLTPNTHYYIEIIPPADTYTISPFDRGADDTRDSDFDWRDNFGTPDPTDRVLRSMRFTASAGMQRDDLDAGLMPNSDLDVRVWRDTDGDGVQDTGEQGMAGVSLFLRRANFTRYRDPLTTDSDGFVTFTNLPAGDYYVQITVPSSYSLSPFNIGPDDNIDNDFAMAFDYETGSGNVPRTLRFTLAPGLIREDIDAGLKQP